jgi:hypothetical protein
MSREELHRIVTRRLKQRERLKKAQNPTFFVELYKAVFCTTIYCTGGGGKTSNKAVRAFPGNLKYKEDRMKRIIPLLAVAIAMAIPATMSAQTIDYYGYTNDRKIVLMEWVEDGITSGSITFDTQAHEDDFMDLINDLYSSSNAMSWSQCITIAAQLESASAYITEEGHRVLVAALSRLLAEVYSSSAIMVISNEYQTFIRDALLQQDPCVPDTLPVAWGKHVSSDDGQTKEYICRKIWLDETHYYHIDECHTIYEINPA